jgi:hypothetical protein
MSADLIWPAGLRPTDLEMWVQPMCARATAPLSGHVLAAARPGGERWVARLAVRGSGNRRARTEALVSALGNGRTVLVPAWRFDQAAGALGPSMDDYAARIGPTGFSDGTGFADDTDAGRHFIEGHGTPHLSGAAGTRLAVSGCAPSTAGVLALGDAVQVATGRLHLMAWPLVWPGLGPVTAADGPDSTADAQGVVRIEITPGLRGPIVPAPLAIGGTVRMRLSEAAAFDPTSAGGTTAIGLALEEAD